MARRTIKGRVALDRTGVAAHTAAARSTVNHWHRHREATGFPDGFTLDGGEWFWLDDITAFHTAHLAANWLVDNTLIRNGGTPNSRGVEIAGAPGATTGTQVLDERVVGDYYGVFHTGDTGTRIASLQTSGVTQPVGP